MSDQTQEFTYLKGMLAFRLPCEFRCGYDPVNRQAVFYQDREGAGMLRLALAGVMPYDSQGTTLLEFARELSGSNELVQLSDDAVIGTRTEHVESEGADYLTFHWYHIQNCGEAVQAACFTYQASFAEMQDPEFHFNLAALNQEIGALIWERPAESYKRMRAVLLPGSSVAPDFVHYSISGNLSLALATEDEGRYEYMTAEDLRNWGLTVDSAWRVAFDNVNDIVDRTTIEVDELVEGVPVVCFAAELADQASLLVSSRLKELVEPHIGWPVQAVLPCRDFLHLFPSSWQPSPDQERVLCQLVVEEFKNSPEQLSTELFLVSDEGLRALGVFFEGGFSRISESSGEDDPVADELVSKAYPNPRSAEDFYNRGLTYSSMLAHRKAIKEFTLAIELNPTVSDYYRSRAVEYELTGDIESARKDISMAKQMDGAPA